MLRIILPLFLFLSVGHAQEDEVSEISTPAPSANYSSSESSVSILFDQFGNKSFRTAGIEYGAEYRYTTLDYYLFGGVSALYGQVRGKNIHEFGNPRLGAGLMFFEQAPFEFWLTGEHKFARGDAWIAARHHTATPGLEIQFERLKTTAKIAGKYHYRYGESENGLDIKDAVSSEISVGRKVSGKLTLEAQLLWFRAFGVVKDGLVYARESDWAGAGPGVQYRLGQDVHLKSSLIFPIHQNRSQSETEVAVWDLSVPNTNEVTWRTDVGVKF